MEEELDEVALTKLRQLHGAGKVVVSKESKREVSSGSRRVLVAARVRSYVVGG